MPIQTERRHQFYKSFEAKALKSRSFLTRFADDLTATFGSTHFLILNAIFFTVWVAININIFPIPVPAFDPFPFGLLTMIVSLEAIFLAIIVLISQNRAAKIADLREEVELQLNVRAEEEITKLLIIVDEIHDHLGLNPEDDAELTMMKKKTDLNQIEEDLAEEMGDEPRNSPKNSR